MASSASFWLSGMCSGESALCVNSCVMLESDVVTKRSPESAVQTRLRPSVTGQATRNVTLPYGTAHKNLQIALSIILAAGLLSASFGSHPRWRGYRRTAVTLAWLVVLAFVLQFIVLLRGTPPGLANRLFVAVLLAWLFTTSIRLRALTRE